VSVIPDSNCESIEAQALACATPQGLHDLIFPRQNIDECTRAQATRAALEATQTDHVTSAMLHKLLESKPNVRVCHICIYTPLFFHFDEF
jgi:hypothetical protein